MKYRTVVIDPPWDIGIGAEHYEIGGAKLKKTLPYKVMSNDEIRDFSIDDFADDKCDLFMWVTHTTLPIGLQIIDYWGFKYHCLLTWDKTNGLCIKGFQRKTEYVIYAYRGRMGVKQKGHPIPTLIKEKLTTHSTKPKSFYSILVKNTLSPRIDIFARKKYFGFDSWGNEVEVSALQLEAFI